MRQLYAVYAAYNLYNLYTAYVLRRVRNTRTAGLYAAVFLVWQACGECGMADVGGVCREEEISHEQTHELLPCARLALSATQGYPLPRSGVCREEEEEECVERRKRRSV